MPDRSYVFQAPGNGAKASIQLFQVKLNSGKIAHGHCYQHRGAD